VYLTLVAIPFYVLTMLLEHVLLARQGRGYDPRDTAASLGGGVGNRVVAIAMSLVWVPVFSWAWEHRLVTWSGGLGTAVALVVLEDLTFYVYHRTSHEVRFFWASHVVHHSSRRYTLGTALRQPWHSPIVGTPFWLPLAFLGFQPAWIFAISSASLLYQYWIHTEAIRTLGPLEWVLNTPSHHRVHHAVNPRYIDRNHGGIFIVWDRLFGTFEAETETPRYGITTNLRTHRQLVVQFHEFQAIAREVRAARTWREAWHALTWMPPRPVVPDVRAAA
jgi:sterol desaturase/sphingolipid hydroxylase (fatty acid hydroxylase superfamily)